jgi:hypothetical protein
MSVIHVVPQAVGWAVMGCGEPLFFRAGAPAERAGRRIAEALAAGGGPVELLIADRAGRLAGRVRFGGDAALTSPEFDYA